MIKPIVNFLLKRKVSARVQHPGTVYGDLIMDVAVLAVFEKNESFAHITSYVNEWRKRGMRKVDFYIYFPNKKLRQSFEAGKHDIPFDRSDFNFMAGIVSEPLKTALAAKYDVMVDLSRGHSLRCDIVLTMAKATWKAGEKNSKRAYLLDLMIDVKNDKDIRQLIHHLDHYLLNINKMNAA